MVDFDVALTEFIDVANALKEAYAEKEDMNTNYLMIIYDDNNYTTIVPTNRSGTYIGAFRD